MFARKNNGGVLLKLVLVLVVLVAVGVVAFRSFQVTARVKNVNRDDAVDAVTGSVTVSADGGYKEVKSEIGGKVMEAGAINKGSHFTAKAPLVKLDTTDIERQIAETERNFLSAQEREKIDLENNKEESLAAEKLATVTRLRDLGTSSDEEVKAAQRLLDDVRKRLRLAEFDRKKRDADYKVTMENLLLLKEKMTILAPPVDGEVKDPLTWEGALIGNGQSIAVVFSTLRVVSARINEESFGKVKLGQTARLRLLTYGEKSFDATVSKILTTADETQRFEVWLDVKVDSPDQLKPGSTGEVTITVARRPNAIVIPRRAVFGGDQVWVVKSGRVVRRKVKTGFDSALNVVEILEGLEVDEQVIVDRLDEFHEGQRVQVQVVN